MNTKNIANHELLIDLIIIENLVGVLQDGANHTGLPPSIGNVGAGIGAHQRGSNDDKLVDVRSEELGGCTQSI